ncbi:MAG TPA: CHASE domain-containing protein, partial [Methylibium sp.]
MSGNTALTASLRFLLTAAAYALVGMAALLLAIPTGHASPLFPSAGIALVCVLFYGPRLTAAVALGSFALNLWHSHQQGITGAAGYLLPACIALGAAAQAWVGAFLVRRYVAPPFTLDAPREIGRFLLLGGALACLVSGSVAVSALALFGAVPREQLAYTWWIWWSGDTLGVLIAAPIVLCLIGQPRSDWAARRLTVALPLAVATLLLSLAIIEVSRWDEQRVQVNFERDAVNLSNAVQLRMQAHLDALDAMYGVYAASEEAEITREEFRRAATPWLHKLPGLQAIGFHQRVARSDIPAFEMQVRKEGLADFHVFDRPEHPVPGDAEVMAMRYIEPLAGNASALGVNVFSIPASRAAIGLSQRSDQAIASAAFRLTQDTPDRAGKAGSEQAGVVVYRAVYKGSPRTPEERIAATRGTAFITLRMGDAMHAVAGDMPAYLGLCLLDADPAAPRRRLVGPEGCEQASASRATTLRHVTALAFAGRQWELRVTAPHNALASSQQGSAGLFSGIGLLATTLLGALLLVVTGRTQRIEVAVRERTTQLEEEIHERRIIDAALRESEQRFRSIFNTVPIGVVYTDLDWRVRQPNAAFCRLTGYSPEELSTMTLEQLTHPEDREADRDAYRQLIAGEMPTYRRNRRYLARNGRVLRVNVTIALLHDERGQPRRAVGVVEDISEHLRLLEAEQRREAAEASNRAKSEFLSRMSHELRTPLNAMLGFAQLMSLDDQRPLSERQAQWVAQIQHAGWHLLEMINDVLDLSRIESGTVSLQVESLDLAELVRASAVLIEAEAAKRGISLLLDLAPDARAVLGDATRVKQILTNLLSNAVKYNRDGGSIRLRARPDRSREGVEIEISDTGIGMNETQLASLFQPFNRLGRERSGPDGTGIGLVIARRLAELMGGSLRASSVENQGSSFTLTLPQAHAPDAVPSELDRLGLLTDDTTYHRRRVHYIEDNETNAEVMRGMLLQRPQVALEISSTGLDGLAAIKQHRPDLVLLDMHLPDID